MAQANTSEKTVTSEKIVTSDRMGEVAGRIWKQLHAHGPVTFASLTRSIGFSEPEVCMALGWLAREGKLCTCAKTGNYSLVEREMSVKF
jgi:hypothetical protein